MRLNIPVLLEDAPTTGSGGSAGAAGHHEHGDDPSQPLPGPAPVLVFVG
jgi:hypothetical protein